MLSVEVIQTLVLTAFPGAVVEVQDMTGGNDHFELKVVSGLFEGKSLVERHRMVYAAVWSATQGEIHALALKTLTPSEDRGVENGL